MENSDLQLMCREIAIEKPPGRAEHCGQTFVTVFGLLRGPTGCSLQEQALPSKDLPTGK
jgi:hypothetical protein